MRFLADMGISISVVRQLVADGHDAVHLRDQGLAKLSDKLVLQKAQDEHRILLTFDLDFGNLMAAGGHALPSVVLFLLDDQTPAFVRTKLLELIAVRAAEMREGTLIVVNETSHRIRRLPIK